MSELKKIQDGFNKGYLLQKHHPALAQKLIDGLSKSDNPFSIGIEKGIKEYQKEKVLMKSKNFDISKIRTVRPSKEKSKDMDKDKEKEK